MVMEMLRKGAAGGLGKVILMGFMGLAVGGLVLMDMGGFFRGGVSNNDVAKIGDHTLSARAFDQTVRRTLSQVNLQPAQAYQMGFIDRILRSEIASSVLGIAAHDTGLIIGDEYAAKYIASMVAPMAGPGGDIKSTLDRILTSQGMSEAAFVGSIKADLRNQFLAESLQQAAGAVSEDVVKQLYLTKNQKRSVSYVNYKNENMADIAHPTEEQLTKLYEKTKAQYASPERRDLKVIVLNIDALKDKIDVSDSVLRSRYDEDKDLYAITESWLLEQALVDSMETAKHVFEKAKSSGNLTKAVTDVTGSETAYLGEKNFTKDVLPEVLKDKITDATSNDSLLEPVQTPLGVRVVKVKKYTPAGVQPFEQVKSEIEKDILETQLIDQMYDQANVVDDFLAGGGDIDTLKEEADVDVLEVANTTLFGEGDFADLQPVSTEVIELSKDLAEGETSPMQELSNGQFVAVMVDKLTPKTYQDFEDVKDQLSQKWTDDQKRISNRTKVKGLVSSVSNIDDLNALAKKDGLKVQTESGLERGAAKGDFLLHSIASVFEANLGTSLLLDTNDGYALAVVTDVKMPESVDEKALKQYKSELISAQKEEVMTLYLNHKRDEYGVKINDAVLDRMYNASDQ